MLNPLVLRAAPWIVVLVLGLTLKSVYDGRRRAEGREQIAIAARQTAEAELRRRTIPRVDTQYKTDTLRLWRARAERAPIRDTVEHWLTDTVPVPVEVVKEIVRVDSVVIAACSVALQTCEQRVAARDSLISVLSADRSFWRRKADPSLLTRMSTALKWAAIGYVAGKVTP